jgi:gliding motility-associated-like protein
LTTDRFGNSNSAYYFDGIDDYISVPNTPGLNPANGLSIALYFNPARNGTQNLIGKIAYTGGVATQFQVAMDYAPYPGVLFGVNPISNGCIGVPVNSAYVSTTSPIALNQWYCIVATFDNGAMKIYRDGVLIQTSNAGFTTLNQCANATIQIGKWWNGDPLQYQGKIDDIRIYNRALNQDEVNALCTTTASTSLGCSGSQFAVGGTGYDRAYDVAATTNNEYYVAGVSRSFSTNDDLLITRVTSAGTIIWAKKIGNAGAESVRKITPTADGGLLVTGQTKSFTNPNGDMLCMKLSSTGNIVWSKIFGLGSSNGDLGMDIIETTDGGYAVSGIINVVGFSADGVVMKLDNNGNLVWAKRYNRGDGEDGVGVLQKADTLVVAADLQNSGSHYEFMLMKLKLADGSFIMSKKFTPSAHGLFNPYIFKNPAQPGYLISGHTIDFDVYTNMNHTVIAVDDNFNVLHSTLVSVNPTTNDFYTGFVPLADGSWIGCATPQTNADAYVYRIGSDNSVFYARKINAATDYRFYRLAVSNNKAMAVGGVVTSGQEDFYLNSFNIDGISDSSCNVETVPTTIQQPTYSVNNFTWPTFANVSFPNITSTLTATTVAASKTNLCPTCVDSAVVVNSYTPVLALNNCNNKLTVEDASGFNVGDTVLLIQMKGAVIDSSNTAGFGTVTDYKNAGNYEFNYVKSRSGNVIELKDSLTKQYNIPTGKVQLVRVPYYENLTVNSTLTCLPWDGSKGGILVFNVMDGLSLQNNIDVTGKGFSGGHVTNTNFNGTNCFSNNYYYPNSSILAAPKGESIAVISTSIASGKGKSASGGGGGNDHNSGGGGGGNATAGGLGGYQLYECDNTFFDNRGIGGIGLSYSNFLNRIYLGGGGGAGHCNNGWVSPSANTNYNGGNGGGMVLINANSISGNNFSILAKGDSAYELNSAGGETHDGMGGGGAGGTVLLSANTYSGNLTINVYGGKGGDMHASMAGGHIGPGGGGAGGVVWLKQSTIPSNVAIINNGGRGGYLLQDNNNPYGTTAGSPGLNIFNLAVTVDSVLFKINIDSVRIKDSATGCNSFDFQGLAYTNRYPISNWQWYFGDGGTASTQNSSHSYILAGTYTVKLVVTDINGCKDSTTKIVTALASSNYDFNYQVNVCTPLTVQFNGVGTDNQNPYWSFGDGGINLGSLNPIHTYAAQGNYLIKYTVLNANCPDTISKTINLSITPADIILTRDTTICYGVTKQLLTAPSLSFCWNPVTYLDNPNAPNPITSTPQNITYYFTAQVEGTNVIANGNFSQGNIGFTSQYTYATPNITEGQYYVGTNPQAWNVSLSPCPDHTTGTGNMMLINGAPTPNVNVWTETVTVTPNTNYAFSTWVQALWPPNPAQLKFSINGNQIGTTITASLPTCTWTQFYTTWNSGNNTSATISIVNINTAVQGNDFALDDISFAPVLIKRDSVIISVERPVVTTNPDTSFCQGVQLQLNSAGANSYSWTPPTGLSNPTIANPVASPVNTTQYIVTGTTLNGCSARDSVLVTIIPAPVITTLNDTIICKATSVQLSASGGTTYSWSPTATLNNPTIANPIATPTTNMIYNVIVGNANNCTSTDSIRVDLHPDPVFAVSSPASICQKDSLQLYASGGNIYNWQPSSDISNPNIANPKVFPLNTTTYTVQITETVCNNSASLATIVTVHSLPNVTASKSNDIDCTTDFSQLNATGAVRYLWSPASSLNNPNIANPIASPVSQTLYTVKGFDANNCTNYDTVTVDITSLNKGGYLMPSAFTPNNDGLNDCYGIKYWGVIEELDFRIYNRWGEMVFHTSKPSGCWDGTFKGVKQDSNVFVYLIKAKTTCGEVIRKGTFVLIR